MRRIAVLLHRYVGLLLAGFLFIAGLTGGVIAFHTELDRLLNPDWFAVRPSGSRMTASQWVAHAEAQLEGMRVDYIQFPRRDDDAAALSVSPREGKPDPHYNQVFLDPYTGQVLGKREWGTVRLDRGHLIPFIYELHYSLHLGDRGVFIFGIIALIWFFDCFVGMYLAWPKATWEAIKRALTVKWRASPVRVNYDLHRAGGIWFWIVLAVLAFSGVALNLNHEVFEPMVSLVSPLSPWPEETVPKRNDPESPLSVSIENAVGAATAHLQSKGIAGEIGAVGINFSKGIYRVRYRSSANIMADHPELQMFVSGETAAIVGGKIPGRGTAGDVLDHWQYPLHSGKAFGLAGRIVICITGIVTAMLSVTGVYLWWKKRRGRTATRRLSRE